MDKISNTLFSIAARAKKILNLMERKDGISIAIPRHQVKRKTERERESESQLMCIKILQFVYDFLVYYLKKIIYRKIMFME